MQSPQVGAPKKKDDSPWIFTVIPFPQARGPIYPDTLHRVRSYGRDAVRIMQLALDPILCQDDRFEYGRHEEISKLIQSNGHAPGSVDYLKAHHQVVCFIRRTGPLILKLLEAYQIHISPVTHISAVQRDYMVVGSTNTNAHEYKDWCSPSDRWNV